MADIQDPGATPEALSIKKIGVIGAGQMGSGIAHVAAVAGIDIVLNDIGQEQLDKAIANIDKNLERQVQRERISAADKQDALARLSGSTDHAALGDWGVQNSMFAVFALQTLGTSKYTAEVTDVLAHQDYVGVALQHVVHGRVERLHHIHLRHC